MQISILTVRPVSHKLRKFNLVVRLASDSMRKLILGVCPSVSPVTKIKMLVVRLASDASRVIKYFNLPWRTTLPPPNKMRKIRVLQQDDYAVLCENNKRYIRKVKENNSWSPIAQLLGDSQQSNYESPSKHWDYYSLCSSTNWNKLEKTKTKTFHSTAGEWHLVLRRYPGTSSIYSQLNNKILEDFVFLYLKQVLLKSYELL